MCVTVRHRCRSARLTPESEIMTTVYNDASYMMYAYSLRRIRYSCWDTWTSANPTVNQSNVHDKGESTTLSARSDRVRHRSVSSRESCHV